MILAIDLPASPLAARSHYLKVRDRASYEFALVSVAACLRVEGGKVAESRVALGGVGTRPWRSPEAEAALLGRPASPEVYAKAAEAALADARVRKHNAFKKENGPTRDRPRPEHPGRSGMNLDAKANLAVGKPFNRVDGRLKVTGAAAFSAEYALPGILHAVLVQSTIARGTIRSIDAGAARKAPGVAAVYTHEDAPKLIPTGALDFTKFDPSAGASSLVPLRGPEVYHVGQHIGMVVADTVERAKYAASLLRFTYEPNPGADRRRPRTAQRPAAQEHDGGPAGAGPRRRRGRPGRRRGQG